MASYFLAYENYDGLDSIVPVTLKYAKNIDILFAVYSYTINLLTGTHKFIYYFITVFISLFIYTVFIKKYSQGRYVLFALLLYILFFKTFQLQWNVIRSSMAIPIFFLAIHYSIKRDFKKGIATYVLGGLIHGSTAILLLPLFIVGPKLTQPIKIERLLKMLLVVLSSCAVLLALLYLKSSYLWFKITTQSIEFNIDNAVVFIIALIVSIPLLSSGNNVEASNVVKYLLLIAFLGFFFGKNFYRFSHPLLAFIPLTLVLYVESSRDHYRNAIFKFIYASFCYLSFIYVLFLNQTDFFYLENDHGFVGNHFGFEQVKMFFEYIYNDIDYYDGYRI